LVEIPREDAKFVFALRDIVADARFQIACSQRSRTALQLRDRTTQRSRQPPASQGAHADGYYEHCDIDARRT
jgi:hypothetical protein